MSHQDLIATLPQGDLSLVPLYVLLMFLMIVVVIYALVTRR